MDNIQLTALVIFAITYFGIIFTRLPKVNVDRPSAAFFGAIAMILSGVVSFEEAMASIDFNTIALLLGMMIIIATMQSDGFFALVAHKTVRMATNSKGLLTALVLITGIGSAFLVNDAVVLIITPITISICNTYKLNPIPYLIAIILSSNAGSVMTMTGNPQNMLIGINSGMSYLSFFLHLLPIAFLSMGIVIFTIRLLFASEFKNDKKNFIVTDEKQYNMRSMRVSAPVFGLVVVLFFLSSFVGLSIPLIALFGASLIMLFGKIKPAEILKQVDWVLLLFFSGLFIVVHAIEKVGLLEQLKHIDLASDSLTTNVILHGLGLFVSQIISNVPYAIAMIPVIRPAESEAIWLILASSSTLAGNATIIGAIANLIVIESAARMHVRITFKDFFLAGILSTFLSLCISILVIQIQVAMGLLQ